MDLNKGKLRLENGEEFFGYFFGYEGQISGEVVFNTGMVGYPQSISDPSYWGQILVFTYPLIGNYGVPNNKIGLSSLFESSKIQVKGVICSEYNNKYSHWNSERSLSDLMKEEKVPGLFGIDTRKLTKILREKGTMLGRIEFEDEEGEDDFFDPNDKHIISNVTCENDTSYNSDADLTFLFIDCGIKHSILKAFTEKDVNLLRVPYNFDPFEKDIDFQALIISNGPGNPGMNKNVINIVKKALQRDIPVLGICLGAQIICLAAGGEVFKLKYGHRSQNQPVTDLESGRCYITSQNHGYAIERCSLPDDWTIWFRNANDDTVEGIKHKSKPFWGIQFHPEGNPGPLDTYFLFDDFIEEVKRYEKHQ